MKHLSAHLTRLIKHIRTQWNYQKGFWHPKSHQDSLDVRKLLRSGLIREVMGSMLPYKRYALTKDAVTMIGKDDNK